MSSAGNQQSPTEYRPISRKYLRYLLEGLNEEDSGAGTFAQLAVHLIHRRKCANVVPATEPSAGGDLGQDARTQQVFLDSDGRFRLYASPPSTPERWIFAFSIRKDWQTKLGSDAAKIIANNLSPDAIVFVTNQFIHPEHVKIDEERVIKGQHGVRCEILDGQWMLDQLYEDDYPLAIEFLGCPPESDPKLMEMFRRIYGLQEGGLTQDEAIELEQLKRQVQYRNRYLGQPEHLVQDLGRIGTLLTRYEASLEEGIQWYEEALPELDRLKHLPDGIELLYAYFKALRKLPDGSTRIFVWLPKFIDMVIASEIRGLYHYASVWLPSLFPSLKGHEPFDRLYRQTVERFRALDRRPLGDLSLAYLDETILLLDWVLVYGREQEAREWLHRVHVFLQTIRHVQAFPCEHIAGVLGALAPYLSHIPEFEACFDLATDLKSQQEGGFSKAQTLKQRAFAHAQAKQWQEAIHMMSRAKDLWLSERGIRGSLLATYVCAYWYDQLDYLQAAEYELLTGIHLATWQPAYMESDIVAAMFLFLASLALEQGRVLRMYRWLQYYQPFCSFYRLQPNTTALTDFLEGNALQFAMYLYRQNRLVHDRLLEIVDGIHPSILQAHKEINLSTDEEFEVWLSDLTPEEQVTPRDLRQKVHQANPNPPAGWIEYDELAHIHTLEWRLAVPGQEQLTVQITYPRDPRLARLAFTLATCLQIWSVFLHRKLAELLLADDTVSVTLDWQQDEREPLKVDTCTQHGEFQVKVSITPPYLEQVSSHSTQELIDLFLQVAGSMLMDLALNPPDEVVDLFAPDTSGEAIRHFSQIATPAYLWGSAFAKAVLGVDDDA